MSDEDAFLSGIAADRADRTRLLVFADWLADRSDPREEFVRLHARLLDMDGTDPEFKECERAWNLWIHGRPLGHLPHPKLDGHWLDAMCRVCTTADVNEYEVNGRTFNPIRANVVAFGTPDYAHASAEVALNLYHGLAIDYPSPFEFVAETLLADLWEDPFLTYGVGALDRCVPLTRPRFWEQWGTLIHQLREPPQVPVIAPDNRFTGAQSVKGGLKNWGLVATYQRDYFALFWSTTA